MISPIPMPGYRLSATGCRVRTPKADGRQPIALSQCDQFIFRLGHVRDGNLAQNLFNALADLAQRLAYRAAIGMLAIRSADGDARCDEYRALDGANHFV